MMCRDDLPLRGGSDFVTIWNDDGWHKWYDAQNWGSDGLIMDGGPWL